MWRAYLVLCKILNLLWQIYVCYWAKFHCCKCRKMKTKTSNLVTLKVMYQPRVGTSINFLIQRLAEANRSESRLVAWHHHGYRQRGSVRLAVDQEGLDDDVVRFPEL